MTRSDLVSGLAAKHPDLTLSAADDLVAAFFDAIITRLVAGGRVEVRGFGSFTTRARVARVGRNPRSGEPVDVGAKRVPFFKAAKELRERIDEAVRS